MFVLAQDLHVCSKALSAVAVQPALSADASMWVVASAELCSGDLRSLQLTTPATLSASHA